MAKAKKVDRDSPESIARREAFWNEQADAARAYWRVGMVTSLPVFCDIEGYTSLDDEGKEDGNRVQTGAYTQMLPGVIESIADDKASVRIYAAPEYGYRLEDYDLHKRLAINVNLYDLGRYALSEDLEAIVRDGLLEHGSPEIAAKVRQQEREYLAGINARRGRGKHEPSASLDLFAGDEK